MSKQLVLKTVRSNGDSCYAPGLLNVNYQVGKTYKFHPDRPAHCFVPQRMAPYLDERHSFSWEYKHRPEPRSGNRLLICLAEGSIRTVQLVEFWDVFLLIRINLSCLWKWFTSEREVFAATELEVIGEIIVPSNERSLEDPKLEKEIENLLCNNEPPKEEL